MSEIGEFMEEVDTIARLGQTEAVQKRLVGSAFARRVDAALEFHSKDDDPKARVRTWVADLHSQLKLEIDRNHPDPLGMVIDHAHDIVAEWLRRH